MEKLQSVFGLLALLAIAWALSTDRRRVNWRAVIFGTALQLVFAVLILRTEPGQALVRSAWATR